VATPRPAGNKLKRIAVTQVLGDPGVWYSRILSGIEQYVAISDRWEVKLVDAKEKKPEQLLEWGVDGALIFAPAMDRLGHWKRLGVPIINIANNRRDPEIPSIDFDNHAIGHLAARHLMGLGLKRFAMVQLGAHEAARQRQEGFLEALQRYERPAFFRVPVATNLLRLHSLKQLESRIEKWLLSLPLPVGIMGFNDEYAKLIVQACRRLEIAVPEQVAVIGCDDDEVYCGLCTPTLTSVQPAAVKLGFEAAELMDRLLSGTPLPHEVRLLEPLGIHQRGSTDVIACDDAIVARALEFIRTERNERIRVTDVVEHVGVSRRSLERRFQDHLGRSPLEDIHRHQRSRAQELLRRTDLPLEIIAARSGYRDANHLIRQLSGELGESPTQYRSRYRIT
jgi:LacI family transcriptional regulator